MGLCDVPVIAGKFTWFRSDGSAMSRHDRFLLSDGLVQLWNVANQAIGNRDLSAHCPIWAWIELKILGSPSFILKEKLKCLKVRLKIWNKEVFGILDLDVDIAVKSLKKLDTVASLSGFCNSLSTAMEEAISLVWQTMNYRESILRQKSRHHWFREGDVNSRFFHKCMKQRFRHNCISVLHTATSWKKSAEEIKKEVLDHFQTVFSEPVPRRPFL
ncbi:unnamed protein product [Lathyrus sativus]|nr:unnamed protein product [Lathyrus sativus]